MNRHSIFLSAALSGLIAAVAAVGNPEKKESADVTPHATAGECHGINSCRGKGDCGGKGYSCAGKNPCKAQGWVKLSKKACEKKGGKYVEG